MTKKISLLILIASFLSGMAINAHMRSHKRRNARTIETDWRDAPLKRVGNRDRKVRSPLDEKRRRQYNRNKTHAYIGASCMSPRGRIYHSSDKGYADCLDQTEFDYDPSRFHQSYRQHIHAGVVIPFD